MSPDLALVGLGLRRSHLTREGEQALRACRRVYAISYVPEALDTIRELCADVVDLRTLYRLGQDRLTTYKEQATTVLDAALDGGPVGLAVYGHPLILAMPSMFILRTAPPLGLQVRVVPGISALDCLLADLGVDPFITGVQAHEATDLMLFRRPLLPSLATVLWQVGSLETRLHTLGPSRPERLVGLQDYLTQFFPPDHPAFAVSTAVRDDQQPEIHRMTLADLPRHSALLHLGVTVYLPPAETAPADAGLAARLTDSSHLARIARDDRG